MHLTNIYCTAAILYAAAGETLCLPDAVIVVGHVVAVALRVAVDGHHVVGPALEFGNVLVAALLRQVAKFVFAALRIRVLRLRRRGLELRFRLLHGLVRVVLLNTVLHYTLASNIGAARHTNSHRSTAKPTHQDEATEEKKTVIKITKSKENKRERSKGS